MTRYKRKRCACSRRSRRGNILVLSAVLMVVTAGFVAFAVELGMLYLARCELQRAADSAALSATWDLVDEGALSGNSDYDALRSEARNTAAEFASLNSVLSQSPYVPASDVEIGNLEDPTDTTAVVNLTSLDAPNAVRVFVKKTALANQPVRFGFARVLGIFSQEVEAEATAALITNIGGFRAPADGGNLGILPIALDNDTWTEMLAGGGSDDWTWDEATQSVQAGADGIREVNLYPEGTGSPGNRGTVDIGGADNSTEDLTRQILQGVSPSDLEHHGGELKFDECGKLYLNGDTGISAGIKDELLSIKGKPRTIPVFAQVESPGNNATYTITRFVGIRILDVRLTGLQSSKRVTVQPAAMVARGGIPSTVPGQSYFVYSPPWLIH